MSIREDVKRALDKTRPMLRMDGGDVELVDVTGDGIVKVRLKGACGCCPMATLTLRSTIEKIIKTKIPEVKAVRSV